MSREFKFRFYSEGLRKFIPDPRTWMGSDGTLTVEKEGAGDIVIQQFTGLKDKNGKEIYEGDILKVKNYDGWFDEKGFYMYMAVKHEKKEFGDSDGIGFLYIPKDREIAGNIFENPDLIK